jgi:hypothetical protein
MNGGSSARPLNPPIVPIEIGIVAQIEESGMTPDDGNLVTVGCVFPTL